MDIGFYEIIIPKLRKILRSTSIKDIEWLKDKVLEQWIISRPSETLPDIVYGVDGGSKGIDFKGFTLAFITAGSVGYHKEDNILKFYNRYRAAYVDKVTPPFNISERISLYREILEGKIACHSCRDHGLVLMDGTIESAIIAPRPRVSRKDLEEIPFLRRYTIVEGATSYVMEEKPELFDELFECIDRSLIKIDRLHENPICASILDYSFVRNPKVVDYIAVSMEYIEKVYVYGRLLERIASGNCRLVYIAKTSRSTDLFRSNIYPDIILFEKLTSEPGYSKVNKQSLISVKLLPRLYISRSYREALDLYEKMCIYYTFSRFMEYGPVLGVEVIDLCTPSRVNDDSFKQLHDILSTISVNGYPFPLKIAHHEVHITGDDVSRLLHLLGLDIETTGREVLR